MLWAAQQRGTDLERRLWWLVVERYARELFHCASRHHRPPEYLGLNVFRAELQSAMDKLRGPERRPGKHSAPPVESVIQGTARAGWVLDPRKVENRSGAWRTLPRQR